MSTRFADKDPLSIRQPHESSNGTSIGQLLRHYGVVAFGLQHDIIVTVVRPSTLQRVWANVPRIVSVHLRTETPLLLLSTSSSSRTKVFRVISTTQGLRWQPKNKPQCPGFDSHTRAGIGFRLMLFVLRQKLQCSMDHADTGLLLDQRMSSRLADSASKALRSNAGCALSLQASQSRLTD